MTFDYDEAKKLGSKLFDSRLHSVNVYRQVYELSLNQQSVPLYNECYGERWQAFSAGWNEEYQKFKDNQRKEYKVDEFLAEIYAVCKKYNATISSGCGCCGAGGNIKDYYFEF